MRTEAGAGCVQPARAAATHQVPCVEAQLPAVGRAGERRVRLALLAAAAAAAAAPLRAIRIKGAPVGARAAQLVVETRGQAVAAGNLGAGRKRARGGAPRRRRALRGRRAK